MFSPGCPSLTPRGEQRGSPTVYKGHVKHPPAEPKPPPSWFRRSAAGRRARGGRRRPGSAAGKPPRGSRQHRPPSRGSRPGPAQRPPAPAGPGTEGWPPSVPFPRDNHPAARISPGRKRRAARGAEQFLGKVCLCRKAGDNPAEISS